MKKFTSLMMVLLCAITTSWAAATDLPTLTTDAENPVWYLIKNTRSSKYATYAGDAAQMTQETTTGAGALFYFTAAGETADGFTPVKIHNYATNNLLAHYNSFTEEGVVWYIHEETFTGNATGVHISKATDLTGWNALNDANSNRITDYYSQDAGSIFTFELVTDFTSVIDVPAAKTAAVTELENLAKISVLFPDATQAIADVNAVEATGTGLNELNAAIDAINAIVVEYKKNANGKSIKLTNCSTSDNRGGRCLGYDTANNRAAAIESTGDEAIWTLKSCEDGTFKLYNFVNNLYLGAPANSATHTSENDAPSFKFISTDNNKGALVCNDGTMVHIANHTNYKVMSYYSLTDAASLWTIETCEIVVSREEYDQAAAAAAALPYAIQQAYGLVTDATNYYSNYKSQQEGSYEALLDNVVTTFFHSAYGDEPGDGTGVHYIQANLGEGNSVDEFYFYMLPRSGNGNNRPANVTVSGSNDNSEWTEIAQITTTLDSSMSPYLSDKLGTDGTNYQYIRLTVTSTNTGTVFFTLSELYFVPATSDVTNLIGSYNAFATASITSTEMSDAITALVNAESTLALSNIKKEANAIIEANTNNHADVPALGQYTTEAYNALVTASEATDATQESIEAAIAAFKAAKNIPVYFITNAAPASSAAYASGKAIIYNGSAWRFESTNKSNKQAWMTIPSYTEENVPTVDSYDAANTYYEICDYLTGTVMRGKKVQIVAIEGWDGAYNLQYSTTTYDAVQHPQQGGALVGWNPATATDCPASAWNVEYIGNSYDLGKLTDEQLTTTAEALTALKTAYDAKANYKNITIGTALGEYTGDAAALNSALENAEGIASKTLVEQVELNNDINAATTALNEIAEPALNMPAAGTYIRIKSVAEWGAEKTYLSSANSTESTSRAAFVADADASTIFYFDGTQLVSYASGNYLVNNSNFLGYNGVQTAGTSIGFEAASDNLTGAYNIIFNGNRKLNTNKGGYTDAAGTNGSGYGYDFNLEEVTELPVTITAAGYATFYAPVDVTYEGIEAYYTTGEVNEEKYLQLVDFEGTIPATDGAILKGNEGTYNLTISSGAEKKAGNKLTGTIATTVIPKEAANSYYVLGRDTNGNVGLYNPINGENTDVFTNTGHKAYMLMEGAAQTIGYSLGFDWGGTTGIENIEDAVEENATKAIYDITGRQIKAITVPGIYIINGKKTFVK